MKDLFLKRKQAFRKECVGYLRYVLNDHFVLFLLVLIGFLAYQYSQLLQDFPENHWPILYLPCFWLGEELRPTWKDRISSFS